jgi:hypothetical protein
VPECQRAERLAAGASGPRPAGGCCPHGKWAYFLSSRYVGRCDARSPPTRPRKRPGCEWAAGGSIVQATTKYVGTHRLITEKIWLHTGGAETKTSGSIGLERRNKRHGAPGDTGHLVACPLAGGVSSWLGWVTARRKKIRRSLQGFFIDILVSFLHRLDLASRQLLRWTMGLGLA